MPELPEVHTTVEGINKTVKNQTIKDVWSDFHVETSHGHRNTVKNKKYFESLRKIALGSKILKGERRGKNILIHLDNGFTIIVHMKMTGHLMYGKYNLKKNKWEAQEDGPLKDPYNQYIHFVISLSSGKQLVLSDMRKFASVTYTKTKEIHLHETVGKLGAEPLDENFDSKKLFEILSKKKNTPIKSALLDQTMIAGIGNIYSDEILWDIGIHPLTHSDKISLAFYKKMYTSMVKILKFSIENGGDSKSDYRNIHGEKGGFQNFHKVYGQKNKPCPKTKCKGIIERIVIGGRSTHFCKEHQIKY